MLKPISLGIALFFALSLSARAETLDGALKKVDKLRDAFGDQFVSAITNLPPAQYQAARDQALAAAAKAGDSAYARDDARRAMCTKFEALGASCDTATSGDDAVSGVDKTLGAVDKTGQGEDDLLPSLGSEESARNDQPQATEDPELDTAPRSRAKARAEQAALSTQPSDEDPELDAPLAIEAKDAQVVVVPSAKITSKAPSPSPDEGVDAPTGEMSPEVDPAVAQALPADEGSVVEVPKGISVAHAGHQEREVSSVPQAEVDPTL